MDFKKRTFGKSSLSGNLGISSRRGAKTTSKISQVGPGGIALDSDAVSEQEFVLESNGKNSVKVKGAFHKDSDFCTYVENEVIEGKTAERQMPLKRVPLSNFEDVSIIPKSARDQQAAGKIPDFQYRDVDSNGNLVAEAREINGKWYKVELAAQLYKERYNNKGEAYTADNKPDGEDDKGFYKESMSRFNYISLVSLGFFVGHQIDEAGNKLNGTEGIYMVEGEIKEPNFMMLTPQKSGARISIGSRLGKVLNHAQYGVVANDDITKSGYLKKGKFVYDGGHPVTIAVYNSDNEIAGKLVDRRAYKLDQFVSKKTRKSAEITNLTNDVSKAAEEIKAEVEESASVEDLI